MSEIVDGNNLIGRVGEGSRETLISELADIARAKRKRLTVVFDGPPPPSRPKVQQLGDVTVVYAAPRTADEEIVRRIREDRDPRRVTVVTDDRALSATVRGAGARTLGIAAYRGDATARVLAPREGADDAKASLPVSTKDWTRWFSDPRNRLS